MTTIVYSESYNHYDLSSNLLNKELNLNLFTTLKLQNVNYITIIDRQRVLGKVDLSFLRNLYWVKKIHIDVSDCNLNDLLYLKESLESISIHIDSKININIFTEFSKLTSLRSSTPICEISDKLCGLKNLILSRCNINRINFKHLQNLICLSVGKCKNWNPNNIWELNRLKGLVISFDNTINNLDFVSELCNLECIMLFYTSKIQEFPNLEKLKKLKRVYVYTGNRLADLTSLKFNESLEDVVIINSKLKAEVVKPLLECPNLKRVYWDLGSVSENKKANDWFAPLIDSKVMYEHYYVK